MVGPGVRPARASPPPSSTPPSISPGTSSFKRSSAHRGCGVTKVQARKKFSDTGRPNLTLWCVNSAALRCAGACRLVFSAHAGDILEYDADDVHPVVEVDEIHCRDNEQGYAHVGAIGAGARLAGQASHSRAHKEVRERPFIAREPDLSEGASFSQRNDEPDEPGVQ